jgi:uncharacterized membrane protein
MKKDLVTLSFFIGTFLFIIGSFLKILKYDDGSIFFELGLTAIIAFIFLSIKEIIKSHRNQKHEKTMWIIGIIFMSTVIGWFYVLSARKRIVDLNNQKTN